MTSVPPAMCTFALGPAADDMFARNLGYFWSGSSGASGRGSGPVALVLLAAIAVVLAVRGSVRRR